jgi:hypothetical protein
LKPVDAKRGAALPGASGAVPPAQQCLPWGHMSRPPPPSPPLTRPHPRPPGRAAGRPPNCTGWRRPRLAPPVAHQAPAAPLCLGP